MVKSIQLFLLLFLATGLSAQFSISNLNPVIDSEMKDDVSINVDVVNDTDSLINVTWEREVVTIPTGWESAICDPVRCWAPTVDSKTFDVPVGARDIELIAHVYPDIMVPGNSVIRLKVYEDDHPDLFQTIEYTFNVGLSTGLTEIEQRSVKLFPNPSQGQFAVDVNLSSPKPVQVRLVNAVGQTVYQQAYGTLSGQQRLTYDGDDLANGFYYLLLDVENATSAFKLTVAK